MSVLVAGVDWLRWIILVHVVVDPRSIPRPLCQSVHPHDSLIKAQCSVLYYDALNVQSLFN